MNAVLNHRGGPIENRRSVLGEDVIDNDTAIDSPEKARALFRGLGEACRAVVQGRDEIIGLGFVVIDRDCRPGLCQTPGDGIADTARTPGDERHLPRQIHLLLLPRATRSTVRNLPL